LELCVACLRVARCSSDRAAHHCCNWRSANIFSPLLVGKTDCCRPVQRRAMRVQWWPTVSSIRRVIGVARRSRELTSSPVNMRSVYVRAASKFTVSVGRPHSTSANGAPTHEPSVATEPARRSDIACQLVQRHRRPEQPNAGMT
jgi:hypothetical protein